VELQDISQKMHVAQDKEQKFKEVMSILPPTEVVTAMAENRKLFLEINQLREKKQARAQNIEVLQEESYKVIGYLVATQSTVKHVA
jgi:hypothetical protein